MIVNLDRMDLVRLVKSVTPNWEIMNFDLIERAWAKNIEDWGILSNFTNKELYKIYKLCKEYDNEYQRGV